MIIGDATSPVKIRFSVIQVSMLRENGYGAWAQPVVSHLIARRSASEVVLWSDLL